MRTVSVSVPRSTISCVASASKTASRRWTPRWSKATATRMVGPYLEWHGMEANELRELGQQFRVDSIRCAAEAKSGHPTSGMSAADLMSVLVANHLHYDFAAPDKPTNDRLIFSKGHASTLLYAIFRAAGAITDEELLT